MAGSAPKLPDIGDTIDGKYNIVRVIAEGGMGVVYEGVHKRLDQRVAIKVLYPHYSTNPDFLTRFDLEGRIAARLQGVNVARVHDIDVLPNGILYMVMDLLSGHDLETELQSKQQLSITSVVDIVSQAATGMREAHALGVVHRDLKPANIFLCPVPDSDRYLVKVLDFGISRVMHDGQRRVTEDFAMLGTALYMSPEQAKSAAHVDGRSDIWALGIIMYELLTGVPPFDGQLTEILVQVATKPIQSPRLIRPDIPEELEQIILRALERDPAKRFQTMDDLILALTPWAPKEGVDVLAQRLPRLPPPTLIDNRRTPRRRRAVIIGGVVGATALIGIVLISVTLATRTKATPIEASFDDGPASSTQTLNGNSGGPSNTANTTIELPDSPATSAAKKGDPRATPTPRARRPVAPKPVDSNPRRL